MIRAAMIAYGILCLIGIAASVVSVVALENPIYGVLAAICGYGLSTAVIVFIEEGKT